MGTPHNPKRSYPGGYDKPRHEFKPTEAQRGRVARMALAGVTRDLYRGSHRHRTQNTRDSL